MVDARNPALQSALSIEPAIAQALGAASSGLRTTGRRSGIEMLAIRSPNPALPSVIWKKNRSAPQAWFIMEGLATLFAMYSW